MVQVRVSALICTKTETKMSRMINKLLLETFMLDDTKKVDMQEARTV